ncbi:MAG: peptidyl-prolyl cis-trans isomerase [Acidobacteria bacterium]|nr:peptidyl-prolyl cis-trans isomerase [Acidobacteriota bacterium]
MRIEGASRMNGPFTPAARVSVIFTLLAVLTGCGGSRNEGRAGDTETPIARVGERTLSGRSFQEYLVDVFGSADEVREGDELLSRILDQFLEEQLFLEKARRLDLETDEEMAREFLQAMSPRIDDSDEKGRERFLDKVRASQLTRKLKNLVIAERVKVTPAEVEDFYQRNPDQFHQATVIQLRQILIDDREKAEEIHADLLKDPDQFQELAEIYSEAPDKGLTMAVEETDLPEEVRAALAGVQEGGLSPLVQDPQGYQIFQLVRRQREKERPLSEVHKMIEGILYQEKSERVLKAYLRELRSEIPAEIVTENLNFRYIERR